MKAVNKLFKNKEMLGGVLFFIGSLYLLYEISIFPTTAERYRSLGPEVFPNVLAGALCALSIAMFIQGLFKEKSALISFNLFSIPSYQMFSIIALLLVYMLFIEEIGFIIWGFVFMGLVQFILGERRLPMLILLSGVVVGCVYAIFVMLLRVPLPRGILFS